MVELLPPNELSARAKAVGLTAKEMCARAGVAESTFGRWKRGVTAPGIDTYQRLLAVVTAAEAEQLEEHLLRMDMGARTLTNA